jgi:hypothetical protein
MLPLGLSHVVTPWPAASMVGPTTAVVVAAGARLPVGALPVGSGSGTVTKTVAVGAAELAPNTPQLARATATHSARKIPGRRLTASILAHPQTSIRQPTMS